MMRRSVLVVAALLAGASVLPVLAPAASAAPTSPTTPAAPALLPTEDPGALGPDVVDELAYDLGTQAFKPSGFPAKVEITAKVYAPQAITGRAPLVILQHGRHATCATSATQLMQWPCPASVPVIPSYRGYDALGRNLASHGMVVVSIGANGINANDGFLADGGASARAQLILEHLRRWKAWDASATGSPFGARFVGHIDLADVGLMGHSRGGEGIAAAVELNQRLGSPYGIRAALALAPVDFGRRVIGGVELGVILPYCDGDVADLQGASYYDDGRSATPGDTTSKMTALLYGANHNYFNTVWTSGPGSFDDAESIGEPIDTKAATPPDPCQPGGQGRLTAAQQNQAGATLMAGFLRRHLQDDLDLQRFVTGTAPYPASTGSARWTIAHHAGLRLDVEPWDSAGTARVNAVDQLAVEQGISGGLVCNQGVNGSGFGGAGPEGVTTTRCPMTTESAVVNDTGVLDVGWIRQGPVLRQPLASAGTDVSGYDGLRMRVAVPEDSRNAARAKQDFTVVLEDATGARASLLASSGTNGLQRINRGMVRHAVLGGVRLPLAAFTGVDLTRIRAVELRFDRTGAGRLALADLAFTQEGTGAAPSTTAGVPGIVPPPTVCRRSAAYKWACALAQLAWGRDPTGPEIVVIARGYPSADLRRRTISQLVASPVTAQAHHDEFVQTYTQDDVDPEWVKGVLSPAGQKTWEVALADLVGGFAYATASTGTTAGTIAAAYESLTGRRPDPGGLAYWTPRVEAAGAQKLGASLVATSAHRAMVVDSRYLQVLGRRPDAAGRAYWIGRLAKAGGEQALLASLLSTESFRAAATH